MYASCNGLQFYSRATPRPHSLIEGFFTLRVTQVLVCPVGPLQCVSAILSLFLIVSSFFCLKTYLTQHTVTMVPMTTRLLLTYVGY